MCAQNRHEPDTSSEVAFRIQDFTTATPLERLGRQISQILLTWKEQGHLAANNDALSSTTLHYLPAGHDQVIFLTERFSSQSSGQLFELTYVNSTDEKDAAVKSSFLHNHSLCFYGGKQASLHRWFGISRYLLLALPDVPGDIPQSHANGLLDSMTLGCRESNIHLPCYVLVSDPQRSHYMGQLVCPSTFGLLVIHYETDSEHEIPAALTRGLSHLRIPDASPEPDCSHSPLISPRIDFFHHFCVKAGLPPSYLSSLMTESSAAGFYAGYRYVYYVDEFPLLRNSFWMYMKPNNGCEQHDVQRTLRKLSTSVSANVAPLLDPVTQLHLICTWTPKKTPPRLLDAPLDPWNSQECLWTLRAVGSDDRPYEDVVNSLTVSKTSRALLSHIVGLYDIHTNTHNINTESVDEHSDEGPTFRKDPQRRFKTPGFVRVIGRQVDQALTSVLMTTTEECERLVHYLFDATDQTSSKDNHFHLLTNSFVFRLTTILTQVNTNHSVKQLWNIIMARLRYHWEHKILIPHLTPAPPYGNVGLPATYDPPVLQKLKVLNCCIQQHHVLTALANKDYDTMPCPVFPPVDLLTCQITLDRISTNNTNNLLPLAAMMEYYLLRCNSTSVSVTYHTFRSWIKSQSPPLPLTLSELIAPYIPKHIDRPVDASDNATLQSLWNTVYKRYKNNESLNACRTLFQCDLDGEMALHYLDNLTPLEIAVDGFHCFIHLILKRWTHTPVPMPHTATLLYELIHTFSPSLAGDAWILGRGALSDWSLYDSALAYIEKYTQLHKGATTLPSLHDDHSNYKDAHPRHIARTIQNAVERFELSVLYTLSLEEKLAPIHNPTLLNSLVRGIETSEESHLHNQVSMQQ